MLQTAKLQAPDPRADALIRVHRHGAPPLPARHRLSRWPGKSGSRDPRSYLANSTVAQLIML
jgi:hypothetical protein